METLVLCVCGHSIGQHEAGGCAGERRSRCDCTRSRFEALDAAVDEARNGRSAGYGDHAKDATSE